MPNDLERLIEQVERIAESERTPVWGDLWAEAEATSGVVSMFTFPNPIPSHDKAPYVISPDVNFFSRLFGCSLKEVFTDAKSWTSFCLRQVLWNEKHLHNDCRVTKSVIINQLGFFAPSLFGVMPIYSDNAVPRIGEPVIRERTDLVKLAEPDFHTSGISPTIHKLYEETRAILPNDFHVEFPIWITGPFGVAYHLRGPLNFLVDLIEAPKFVHELMRFVTHCMKEWFRERARFLGLSQPGPIVLGNDEVGVPMISPSLYEEFVLPYEIDLSQELGGIDYWHSCSDVTPLLPLVARIPSLRMMDVGPRTDLPPAIRLFGQRAGSSLMKRTNPVSDILMADKTKMRSTLLEIKSLCHSVPYMLFFSGIAPLDSLDRCTEKILLLDRTCHSIFHGGMG